jgi:hypothetical protein
MGSWAGSTPACYGSSLGSNPDISQKFKMGDISKEVANTLSPAEKIYKKHTQYTSSTYFYHIETVPYKICLMPI